MKKLILIIMMLFVLVSAVSGESLYGIYEEDDQLIVSGTFTESDITHLRDNYYGVIYEDGSSSGQLQVIELDNNYNVLNASVDTYTFSTLVNQISIINFDNATGLSIIGYVHTGNKYINYRSFDVYANGTIRALDLETAFAEDYVGFQFVKTGALSFLGVTQLWNNFGGETFNYVYAGTVSSGGTISISSDTNRYYKFGSTDYASNFNLEKIDNECFLYYEMLNIGYTTSVGCTASRFSSGGVSRAAASLLSKSVFEANEINYMSVDKDETGDFIYLGYAETINKYPVLETRDGSSNALLDKLRLNTDTATSVTVKTLSDSNVLVTYSTSTAIIYKTFTISALGDITEVYSESGFSIGSAAAITELYNSSNRFLSSYTGASGDILIFGTGLIPPPGPDETSLTIKDEKTLSTFDFTDLDLTFEANCVNNQNYQTIINTTSTSIPVDCEYETFAIKVEFTDDNISYNYRRYYIRDLTDTYEQFNLDVYLINPYTTDFVYNEIIIDDLKNQYTNAQVFFEKNIDGVTTQITAYDLDIQNSMMAILMNGESYEVYVDADDISTEYLGTYVAPRAGITSESTTFHLYDVILKADFTKIENIMGYQIYTEDNQIEYNIRTSEQIDDNLINATFYLYEGHPDVSGSVLIYNESVGASSYSPTNLYGFLSGGPFNYTSHENKTVYGKLVIYFSDDGEIRHSVYKTPLWIYNKLTLPLTDYVSQSFLDWFILILLSIVALYATIESANMASLGIIGLAALFVMFGWFTVSSGTLALAALVSLISMLSKKNRGEI